MWVKKLMTRGLYICNCRPLIYFLSHFSISHQSIKWWLGISFLVVFFFSFYIFFITKTLFGCNKKKTTYHFINITEKSHLRYKTSPSLICKTSKCYNQYNIHHLLSKTNGPLQKKKFSIWYSDKFISWMHYLWKLCLDTFKMSMNLSSDNICHMSTMKITEYYTIIFYFHVYAVVILHTFMGRNRNDK